MATVPALRPVVVHFWQRGWFQLSLFIVCLLAVLFCVWLMTRLAAQSKAQQFLQVERARIARDIHDDLGAQLTQLLLLGEVAQREQPEERHRARAVQPQICDHARELAHAMDEVVWAVNSRRDTVRDFTSYVCKYAQIFLSTTGIRCRLDVEPEIPATTFELPVRRNLFLAVKEALNNAAKHSQADELFLRIYRRDHETCLWPLKTTAGALMPRRQSVSAMCLTNMWQRMGEIAANVRNCRASLRRLPRRLHRAPARRTARLVPPRAAGARKQRSTLQFPALKISMKPNISSPPPATKPPVKEVLEEDKPGVRDSWVKLINSLPRFSCVNTCVSGEEALRMIPALHPDIVLMDIFLPRMSGIECTARLKLSLPKIQILMLTAVEDDELVFMALEAGADGYLLKRTKPEDLRAAMLDVMGGGAPMTSEIARRVVESIPPRVAVAETGGELEPRARRRF